MVKIELLACLRRPYNFQINRINYVCIGRNRSVACPIFWIKVYSYRVSPCVFVLLLLGAAGSKIVGSYPFMSASLARISFWILSSFSSFSSIFSSLTMAHDSFWSRSTSFIFSNLPVCHLDRVHYSIVNMSSHHSASSTRLAISLQCNRLQITVSQSAVTLQLR
jgi:hypothetical protein